MLNRLRRLWAARSTLSTASLTERIPFEFKVLDNLKRSSPLLLVSATETATPFFRMLALTHILSLIEVGFVSVLTAFYNFFELSTDMAIYRFVFSAPKSQYEEALAAAHALSIVRGLTVCLLALCAAPFVATAVSLGTHWMAFALLAPAILIRSFEHMSIRIAERDFHYWPQLKATGISMTLSLVVLIIVASITRNHIAIIASVYTQYISMSFLSRVFADVPYRVDFRSPLFKAAFKFGYPLMANGLGLSIAMQGDRFIVAGLFDLQTLAIYSVIMLAAVVPMSLMTRVLQSTILARLFHASSNPKRLREEVRLSSSFVAVLSGLYAGGVILLLNSIVVLVFGQKFHASNVAMMFLGAGCLVRLVRTEPFTSLMLHASRTKRLAASNLVASSSLAFMVLFSFFERSIEAVLAARFLGEVAGLVVTFLMVRRTPESGRFAFSISTAIGFLFGGAACLESVLLTRAGNPLALMVAACAAYAIAVMLWGAVDLGHRIRRLRGIVAPDRNLQTDALPS